MIHEFIGLPGAGKSYLARNLSQKMGMNEIVIVGTSERLLRAALLAIAHPFFFSKLTYILIAENYRNFKLLKHKLLTIVLEIMAREQKAAGRTVIVETGWFQLLLSLFERKIQANDIIFALSWLKKRPYTVHIVEANQSVRLQRIQERGRIPRGGLTTDAERADWFDILDHNFAVIADSIKKNFKYELIQNN